MTAFNNRITTAMSALLLGAALLAGPGAAQVTPEMIDELADGLEEFTPDAGAPGAAPETAPAPETEQADTADAAGFDDFGTLDGWGDAADEGETPDAPEAEPITTPEIPADWPRHEHFGLSAAFPDDFQLSEEARREVSYFGRADFEAETAIVIGFSEGTRDDVLGGVEIIAQEPVEMPDGNLYTRVELAIEDADFRAVGLGLMQQPDIPGQPKSAFMVALYNLDWTDEKRALAETILASVESVVPALERQSGLDGLLGYAMPEGWRSQRERADFLDLIRGHMDGPVLQFVTGAPGRDMASLTRRVQDRSMVMRGDFTESRGEIMGHPARIFEGESDWVSGWHARLYLLEMCAPGNNPIVIHTALRSEDQQAHIDAFLADAALDLPDDMAPCPEAMGPGTTWSRDGQFAIREIEGLEGSAGPFMMSVRPSDRDRRHPEMRVLFDQPRQFNETFQLGNPNIGSFAVPPVVTETEVAGQRAHVFAGRAESREQSWNLHAYLLDTCLADDTPILITRSREVVDPLAELWPDPMTDKLFIDLPDDARPCDPALLQDALARVEAELWEETAPEAPAPAPAPEAAPQAAPLPDTETPADWQRQAHFGLSVAMPPDFALFEEKEVEVSYIGRIDFQAETYIAVIFFREYHPDLMDAPEVFAPEPFTLADGSRFTRFEMAFDEPDFSTFHIGIAQHPDHAEHRPAMVTVARGNIGWNEETRNLAEQILASAERVTDAPAPEAAPAPEPEPAPDAEPDSVELIFWQSIADSQDPADFRAYLDRWPQGAFAALAENRLAALGAAPEIDTAPGMAAMLAECEAAASPDNLSLSELETSDLARAERLCRAVRDAAPDETTPEFIQATALLGRTLQAAGSFEDAARYYRLAAEAGNMLAMTNLGFMHESGVGVQPNQSEAVRWYRAAAEAGYVPIMTRLGFMYSRGRGVRQDDSEAARWYRAAAEAGEAQGMNNLAVMYKEGRGVRQDDAEAVRWWRAAAEAGHATGMSSLGYMYEQGRGVRQDDAEAVRWWRAAAAEGNTEAMHNLGGMYELGRGVRRNPEAAAEWYLRAVAAGETWIFDILRQRPADVVRAMQRRLRDAGHYTGRIDGIAGPATAAALRAHADAN